MGLFGAIHKWAENQKTKNTLEFCWHHHFSQEISNFWYIKKCRYRLNFNKYFLILLYFLESLRIVLINIVAIWIMSSNLATVIWMMSSKFATLGVLKNKTFWNKGHDVIFSVHYVANKILSHKSSSIVDVAMWPKLDTSSISIRKVITTSIL